MSHARIFNGSRAARSFSKPDPVLELMSYRLAQTCLGRENHAAHVEVAAPRAEDGRVHIFWGDAMTRQSGLLGIVSKEEAPAIVRALFSQLRAWRERCESAPPAKAFAAAGGAR